MENSKKRHAGSSSSSSSCSSSSTSRSSSSDSLGYLFGPPKEHYYSSSSSSAPSYSTGSTFGSIFPPPSAMLGRDSSHCGALTGSSRNQDLGNEFGMWNKYGDQASVGQVFKGESKGRSSQNYQHETAEPCYLSSSIYYGGQENYSPRTRTSESQHMFKKDGVDDASDGSNSDSASRGNWWKGSLYY